MIFCLINIINSNKNFWHDSLELKDNESLMTTNDWFYKMLFSLVTIITTVLDPSLSRWRWEVSGSPSLSIYPFSFHARNQFRSRFRPWSGYSFYVFKTKSRIWHLVVDKSEGDGCHNWNRSLPSWSKCLLIVLFFMPTPWILGIGTTWWKTDILVPVRNFYLNKQGSRKMACTNIILVQPLITNIATPT